MNLTLSSIAVQQKSGLPSPRRLFLSCLCLLWLLVPVRLATAVELPPGFVAELLATNLNAVTALAAVPDGRILIAEQTGALRVWKNGRLLEQPLLTLPVTDYWERGLVGVVLDPKFPRQPFAYTLYVTDQPYVHHVLSRFTLEGDSAVPGSQRVLFEGDDQAKLGGFQPAGHQGGPLRFGRDGELYVALGEQTAGEPAQRLDTLQGKILRLNSDGSIPADNPFLDRTTGKYRAIWVIGVRNPFGLATQAESGRMFFTDVGNSAFEEVNELVAGANYGWPQSEGYTTNPAFRSPLYAYPPVVGRSVVGAAFVPSAADGSAKPPVQTSGGTRAPETMPTPAAVSDWPVKWRGKFLFGDFMNHWIKGLDPAQPTNVSTFARGLNGPVALEMALDGSLLVLNRGTIWRDPQRFVSNSGSLVRIRYAGPLAAHGRAPSREMPPAGWHPALGLPAEATRLPARFLREDWWQRVLLAQPRSFWLPDNEWNPPAASRSRVFLPETGRVSLQSSGEVSFPPGTVFVREFLIASVPTAQGAYPVLRTFERRLQVVGAPRGYGASYRINPAGDAELLEDGEQASLGWVRHDQAGRFTNTLEHWWFPAVDDALGVPVVNPSYRRVTAAAELNQKAAEDGFNILHELKRRQWLDFGKAPVALGSVMPGAHWRDTNASVETRVRLYLHANCSTCHQPGGASRGNFDARITTPLAQAGIVNGAPAAGDLGIAGARIVAPGQPDKSLLYQRLKRTDFFRMPPVSASDLPSPVLPLVSEWIMRLAADPP